MKPQHNKLLGRFSGLVLMGGGHVAVAGAAAGVNQFSLSVVTSRIFRLPKGVPTQRRYGHGRLAQACISSAAACGIGTGGDQLARRGHEGDDGCSERLQPEWLSTTSWSFPCLRR